MEKQDRYVYNAINRLVFEQQQLLNSESDPRLYAKAFLYQYMQPLPKINITSALTRSVFGFGRVFSSRLHGLLAFHPNSRLYSLREEHIVLLDRVLRNTPGVLLSDDLKNDVRENKMFFVNIRVFRGSRLYRGMPARGQSTRSNGRTAKSHRFWNK